MELIVVLKRYGFSITHKAKNSLERSKLFIACKTREFFKKWGFRIVVSLFFASVFGSCIYFGNEEYAYSPPNHSSYSTNITNDPTTIFLGWWEEAKNSILPIFNLRKIVVDDSRIVFDKTAHTW